MGFLLQIFNAFQRKIIKHSSVQARIKYLRKQGVKIGRDCNINTVLFSTEPFLIEIGNNTTVASGTEFITHDGSVCVFKNEVNGGIFGKIKIGNNVFIGSNCIILYNTTIGDNCIIGSGSVVRGQFPDNSVLLGNPAKVIMKTSMLGMLFKNNPGLIKTNNLTVSEVQELVKKHFKVE